MLPLTEKEKLIDEVLKLNPDATVHDFVVELMETEAELLRIQRKTKILETYGT